MTEASKRGLRFSLRTLLVLVLLCAIGIETYRRFYVPPLNKIHGLEVVGELKRGYDVLLKQDASRKTVDHLISHLADGMSLWFYDSTYDSPSDPGAYVEIMRHHDGYFAQLANHGWSSSWFPIGRADAVDYLWACRKDNGPERDTLWLKSGMYLRQEAEELKKVVHEFDYEPASFVRSRIEQDRGKQ